VIDHPDALGAAIHGTRRKTTRVFRALGRFDHQDAVKAFVPEQAGRKREERV
jgi:hypothetical protein